VPDTLFTLEIEPGTRVVDSTVLPPKDGHDQPVAYKMPADPNQLDRAIANAVASYEGQQPPTGWSMKTILMVNCIFLASVAGYFAYRFLKRKKPA